MTRATSRALVFVLAVPIAIAAAALADTTLVGTRAKLSLARNFGRRGSVKSIATDELRVDWIRHIATDSAGRIVVAGVMVVPEKVVDVDSYAPVVARLLPTGALDRTFGQGGIVLFDVRGWSQGLTIDRQDRPVFSGYFKERPFTPGPTATSLIVRLGTNGVPEASFGVEGIARLDRNRFAGAALARANPVDSSVFVVADQLDVPRGPGIVKLLNDGSLDPDFGVQGFANSDFSVTAMAVDAEGRVIVGTSALVGRLDANGAVDTEFGSDGLLRGPARGQVFPASNIEIDSEGRILVLGNEGNGDALFRFLPTGELDGLFCDGGSAPMSLGLPGDADAERFFFAMPASPEGPYVLGAWLTFRDFDTNAFTATGNVWRKLDPSAPAAIESIVERRPMPKSPRAALTKTELPSIAVSPDGRTAYAAGGTTVQGADGPFVRGKALVRAIDLTRSKRIPLAEFRIEWDGLLDVSVSGPETHVNGRLRVVNDGDAHVRGAQITLRLSDDAEPDGGDRVLRTVSSGPLPPHSERTLIVEDLVKWVQPAELSSRRVLAVVDEDRRIPEANTTDNVAVSEPLP